MFNWVYKFGLEDEYKIRVRLKNKINLCLIIIVW